MLNRSGNETFLSEAYPTGTTTEFRDVPEEYQAYVAPRYRYDKKSD